MKNLMSLIQARQSVVGVIGLGYVGLPLAHGFTQAGFPVIGFDIDQRKVEALGKGEPYLDHLAESMFTSLLDASTFEATTDMSRLGECDAVLVAVPTPLGRHEEPDLSYVETTAAHIGKTLRPDQLLVLESTTFPGTTREIFLEAIVASAPNPALRPGVDFFVAYSPEREDPGRVMETTAVPKLVGGLDDQSAALAEALYGDAFDKVVVVSSAEVAESAKLLENIFRAVNIALVNEMKIVLQSMDIDIWEVIDAASTKPYGFMPFYPGPGLGGHCIPIDPFYLTWKAKEVERDVQFIELAGLVNRRMPHYVVEQLILGLNDAGKALSRSRILVVGLAYKAGVGDTRESPTYKLIDLIRERGGDAEYHDDLAPVAIPGREFDIGLESVDLSAESIAAYDAVIISTAQVGVPWDLIAKHAQLVVDSRNAMQPYADQLGDRLIRA